MDLVDVKKLWQDRSAGKRRVDLPVDLGTGTIKIPVLFVHGREAGPTALIISTVHGDEYDGAEAMRRYWQTVDPGEVVGTVVFIPVANIPAYEAGNRVNPADPVDMSRTWPGKPDGSPTERISYAISTHILPHVDAVLDMHGGGNIFRIARLAMYHEPADAALRDEIVRLVCALGIPLLWRFPGGSGLTGQLAAMGKPGVGVEIGGEGRLSEEGVADSLRALRNFLIATGNETGTASLPERWTIIEGRPDHSRHAGFLVPRVQLLDRVQQGDVLGVIVDPGGRVLEEAVAPHTGIVTTVRTFPVLPEGGATFQVSREVGGIENRS